LYIIFKFTAMPLKCNSEKKQQQIVRLNIHREKKLVCNKSVFFWEKKTTPLIAFIMCCKTNTKKFRGYCIFFPVVILFEKYKSGGGRKN
jgi:hypothetical protein